MKISILRTEKGVTKRLSIRELETLIDRIRVGNKAGDVDKLRSELFFLGNEEREYRHMMAMPQVFPAVVMTRTDGDTLAMKQMNGVVLLSIGNLCGDDELRLAKQAARLLPMTLAAFVGSSGRSVKVLVCVEPESGQLPTDEEDATLFYQRAYELAALVYERVMPFGLTRVDIDKLSPMQAAFRMTKDESPYLNMKATPLRVPGMLLMGRISDRRVTGALPEGKRDDKLTVGKETQDLIDFLAKNYRFRYNSVMGYTEYSHNGRLAYGWLPVDERMQNRLSVEARLAGLDVWDKDVNRYLKSGIIREYNPIHEYLWSLRDAWDGKDYIGMLAATVPTSNPHWQQWFRTWMLAMVAQWLGKSRQYGNSVAPLLISRQGYNKSTFCKSLIPNELQWGYNDNLQMSDKKSVLQAMGQFLLINLDEFNAISPKLQEGFLKNVIQLASVKVKRPYGKHIEEFPRLASFIATANMTDILSDPSGNRRFIGIELTGPINVSRRINHRQLYAQILHALDEGEPYWFDQQQTELIMQSNRQFQKVPPVVQFFHECFEIPQQPEDGEYMTSAAIFAEVRKLAGNELRLSTLNSFGRILTNMPDLERRRSRQGTEYLVKKRRK